MQQIMPLCHDPIIQIENLSFSYGDQRVIQDLNFMVQQRDFVGIIGSNGAGKTTLLRMLVGLLPPAQGDIKLFGESIRKFKDWNRIGYVPQKMHLIRYSRLPFVRSSCPGCIITKTCSAASLVKVSNNASMQ